MFNFSLDHAILHELQPLKAWNSCILHLDLKTFINSENNWQRLFSREDENISAAFFLVPAIEYL